METPQTKPLVPAGRVVDEWMRRAGMSKPAACDLINDQTRALYGERGTMDRSRLWRLMVGAKVPSIPEAVAIRAASGCPVDLWALPAPATVDAS